MDIPCLCIFILTRPFIKKNEMDTFKKLAASPSLQSWQDSGMRFMHTCTFKYIGFILQCFIN